jgi:hypothetical protein
MIAGYPTGMGVYVRHWRGHSHAVVFTGGYGYFHHRFSDTIYRKNKTQSVAVTTIDY